MLYDLADAPPPPGSLLESIFLIVTKRRQEIEFLQTRLMIEAIREPNLEKSGVQDAFKEYLEATFPYLEGETKKQAEDARTMLKKWTDVGALKIKPLWRGKEHRGLLSKLRKGAEKVRKSEELRRQYRHRRI